jgi:glyoxylase-like metal-dependent hydrolase (beta-lactamase superfamily II)
VTVHRPPAAEERGERLDRVVGAALGRLAKLAFTIDMQPAWSVPAQLRERGVDPGDVRLIVMTHLHYDHASGLSQFPGATVLVDDAEWRAAAKGSFLAGYLPRLFPGDQDWRLLDGGSDAIDLLGDGSVVLLRTPGHTAGHRSVVLRLGGGRSLLLTGDAAYSRATIDDDLTPLLTWRDDAFKASLARLRAWVGEHPGDPVICGHDAARWSEVAPVYE